MTKLNIFEAKTNLSRYLRRVQAGETITLCKNGEPVAQIIPLKPKKKKSGLGLAIDKILWISDDFDKPLTDAEFPGIGL
jgi:prevent-host-death family protein